MAFCCKCRGHIRVSLQEFIDRNAWCPNCRIVVATSMCKVPTWVIAIVMVLSIHNIILNIVL